MKMALHAAIELDVADPREVAAFEQALSDWLHQQQAVSDATVTNTGLNSVVWRKSRDDAFGPRLRSPFARQRTPEA